MLPGNFQYWKPCQFTYKYNPGKVGELFVDPGTIQYFIEEPIHFAGPKPGAQSTIEPLTNENEINDSNQNEEERKE